jgi:hypothetical protein
MIRVLVIGSILLIAGVVPAFAEKVTLACSEPGSGLVYLTIDTIAKTVKDPLGTYPAQITDDAVTWYAGNGGWPNVLNTYDRQTAQYRGWMTVQYGNINNLGTLTCVKAPERPF